MANRSGPKRSIAKPIVVDGTGPALNLLSATQAGTNVLDGAAPVLEGEVELVMEATDALSGLAGPPSLLLSNGTTVLSLSTTNPTSPFHYTWSVDSTTHQGRWDILVLAHDQLGNSTAPHRPLPGCGHCPSSACRWPQCPCMSGPGKWPRSA
jgi:hypothetical protein